MEFIERAFGRFWHRRNQKLKGAEQNPFAVFLDDVSYRMFMVGSAIEGTPIRIGKARTLGGFFGEVLYLPREMDLFESFELNDHAYVYRVVYSTVARKSGFVLESSAWDLDERKWLDLRAVSLVLAKAKAEMPAFQNLLNTIHSSLAPRFTLTKVTTHAELYRAAVGGLLGAQLPPITAAHERLLQEVTRPGEDIIQFLSLVRGISFNDKLADVVLPKIWSPLALSASSGVKETSREGVDERLANLPSGTELEKPPTEEVKKIEFKEDQYDQMPVYYVIEQMKTAEKYLGGRKLTDASDELSAHMDALEELDISEVMRSKERTQSVFHAEFSMAQAAVDLEEDVTNLGEEFVYDEWDFAKRAYRRNWCKVYEKETPKSDKTAEDDFIQKVRTEYRNEIETLKGEFTKLLVTRKWQRRQTDGTEFDLDQLVDRYSTLKSGHTPSENLYLNRRRTERDLATLILLDASMSMDSFVEGKRIMDIAKESLALLFIVLDELSDKFAVAGFNSNTRTQCRYLTIKDFTEKFDTAVRERILGLTPSGYTRIGPAIRHSVEKLSHVNARKKLVLLISDGKPTDYDLYEGRHGIEDVKHACREAIEKNIHIYSLAIDSKARTYFPQMFGMANFEVLSNATELPAALSQLYLRLVKT